MLDVIQVRNAKVLETPAMQEFIAEAFGRQATHFPDPDAVIQWIRERIDDETVGFFVAIEDLRMTGLLVISAVLTAFSPYPWLMYGYAEGAPEAKQALLGEMLDWARERGIRKIWGINNTPVPDEQLIAGFLPVVKSHVQASVIEIEVPE